MRWGKEKDGEKKGKVNEGCRKESLVILYIYIYIKKIYIFFI